MDATYYALPAEQTAATWAARTPAAFTFNVKAFSLFTGHPTRIAALPADLRPAVEKADKDTVYLRQVDPAVAAGPEPVRRGGSSPGFPARRPANARRGSYGSFSNTATWLWLPGVNGARSQPAQRSRSR